jgi:hypothetical protein
MGFVGNWPSVFSHYPILTISEDAIQFGILSRRGKHETRSIITVGTIKSIGARGSVVG